MTTTFEKYNGTQRQNYCTLPTIDVEILTEPPACSDCGKPLIHTGKPGDFHPWQHEDGSPGRNLAPVQSCTYCGSTEHLTRVTGAWHDGTHCGRCGGERGYPIGD